MTGSVRTEGRMPEGCGVREWEGFVGVNERKRAEKVIAGELNHNIFGMFFLA